MRRYRKKPIEVEAIQWTGDNLDEITSFCDVTGTYWMGQIWIRTLEGGVWASVGDWIIKGVKGEFYPCKPDIFEQTYEMGAE